MNALEKHHENIEDLEFWLQEKTNLLTNIQTQKNVSQIWKIHALGAKCSTEKLTEFREHLTTQFKEQNVRF
ncbi:hypothetical protein R8G61_07915 [Tenacibaculum maritimum]